jgi:D-glycero-alpha-D-manno-heptose 1-phosphate guanylyltransferase
MIKEAIILAGGLGTRLQSVVSEVPKCMALVSGKPFLHYIIAFLQKNGMTHFIFSIGYKHEIIEEYLLKKHPQLNYTISLEMEPLGTGGAIKLACEKATQKNVVICNGDTLYKVDISALSKTHEEMNAACTLSLKPMHYFDRYGVVELNEDHSVKSFKEKQYYTSGLINGGVYALNVESFLKENLSEKFSFEKDYLEKNVKEKEAERSKLYGIIQDEYFIDIGIPEDYARAQKELLNP